MARAKAKVSRVAEFIRSRKKRKQDISSEANRDLAERVRCAPDTVVEDVSPQKTRDEEDPLLFNIRSAGY